LLVEEEGSDTGTCEVGLIKDEEEDDEETPLAGGGGAAEVEDAKLPRSFVFFQSYSEAEKREKREKTRHLRFNSFQLLSGYKIIIKFVRLSFPLPRNEFRRHDMGIRSLDGE